MAQGYSGFAGGRGPTERCLFIKTELDLPLSLIEDVNVFLEVACANTWKNVLSEQQRRHLTQYLPTFPKNDASEKQRTLQRVFAGENMKFGPPLRQFHARLKEGTFSPDIARYAALCRKAKMREYRHQQQVYYSNILKDILINRQRILEAVYKTPVNEPLRLELPEYAPSQDKDRLLSQKVNKRYKRILVEVNEECGAESSDEGEDVGSITTLGFEPPDPDEPQETDAPCNVLATYAPKPPPALLNGQGPPMPQVKPRPRSPTEFCDDDYREMMRKHRKRRIDGEYHPELQTEHLNLVEILHRAMPSRKALLILPTTSSPTHTPSSTFPPQPKMTSPTIPSPTKKKPKEKTAKRRKVKVKVEAIEDVVAVVPAVEEAVMASSSEPHTLEDNTTEAAMVVVDETDAGNISQSPPANFFSLLRDFILQDPEKKMTTIKMEERVREWSEAPGSPLCQWFNEQPIWLDTVDSALKFLSGDVIGYTLENFIPYLDYKERAQIWKWIGQGRDSDAELNALYRYWLVNKEDEKGGTSDCKLSSPPAPKMRTSFVVRPTNDDEKETFQKQEKLRFELPHKAFSYSLHGYTSVVGPVKGVYGKESSINKAREHALLIKDRPNYVTILTLVRDAAARLPNGEGTRGHICELLKDSRFLSPGVTDTQINNVVSGALDRLHYEKDPCVKYDVNRKLWIYLHRNRTEDEFERIHLAQGAAAKAKKALQKPKPAKKIKESMTGGVSSSPTQPQPAVPTTPTPVSSHDPGTPTTPTQVCTASTPESPLRVDMPSPGASSPSPRAPLQSPRTPQMSPRPSHTSPKPLQMSPRTSLQATPRTPAQASPRPQTSPKKSAPMSVPSPKPQTLGIQTVSPLTKMVSTNPGLTCASNVQTKAPQTLSQVSPSASPAARPHPSKALPQGTASAPQLASLGGSTTPLALAQQQLAVAKSGGMAVVGGSKPLSVAFLQATGRAGSPQAAPGTSQTLSAGSKPLAFSLIQPMSGKESPTQPRTVVLTPKGETVGQKLLITQQQLQQQQIQQQLQQQQQQKLQQQKLQQQQKVQQQLQQQQQQKIQQHKVQQQLHQQKVQQQLQQQQKLQQQKLHNQQLQQHIQQLTGHAPGVSSPMVVARGGAKLVQTVAGQQVVSMAGLAALQKQMAASPGNTSIKIQGGSILQSAGAKSVTIQRVASLDGSEVKPGQMIIQRPPSREAASPTLATTTMLQTLNPGSPQLSITRGGKPATIVLTKPVSMQAKPSIISKPSPQAKTTVMAAGKPTTIAGKPASLLGKPGTSVTMSLSSVSSTLAAQLIQSSSLGGKPVTIGGKPVTIGGKPINLGGKPMTIGSKPIIIGGKPIQFSGKPISIGGKPVHLIGKPGGGQIGVIQGQGGLVNIVQGSGGMTAVPISCLSTSSPSSTAPTLVGQILQPSGGVVTAGGRGLVTAGGMVTAGGRSVVTAGGRDTSSPATRGMVMSTGHRVVTASSASPSANKTVSSLVSNTKAGVLQQGGHQIIMAPAVHQPRMVNAQQLIAGASVRPAMLRSPGGKPGGNIQMVRTMLATQAGGKPGATTIVLAQPSQGSQPGTTTTADQQQVKVGQAGGKNKGGPIYARIISPPPGIRLTAVRSATQVTNMPGVSVLQAVPSTRLQGDGSQQILTTTQASKPPAGGASNQQQ